jgi:hypothetical protein
MSKNSSNYPKTFSVVKYKCREIVRYLFSITDEDEFPAPELDVEQFIDYISVIAYRYYNDFLKLEKKERKKEKLESLEYERKLQQFLELAWICEVPDEDVDVDSAVEEEYSPELLAAIDELNERLYEEFLNSLINI